jgi:hypothetical protein
VKRSKGFAGFKKRTPSAAHLQLDAAQLTPGAHLPGAPALYLGRFGLADLRRELDETGVLAALAARGYRDPEVRVECAEGEHRLVVTPRGGGESLVDLRMAEGALSVDEPALKAAGLDVLSVLAVHWLALQDPRASFTPERPRLPGQRHPGLGLGRQLYTRVLGWAASWGKDALANVPAYFHNALFYAPPFAFLSGAEHGRFQALRRDLAPLGVAPASTAVDEGRVVDTPTGEVAAWRPGPMLAALSPALRSYFTSTGYAQAADTARQRHRFRVS